MQETKWNLQITLQGPFITQSTRPEGFAIDAAMARRADGRCYLPGTQVKGKARQAWAELAEAAPGQLSTSLTSLFGPPAGHAADEAAPGPLNMDRGRLRFTDCLLEQDGQDELRYRIEIDLDRGSVSDGMLQVIESRFAAGEQLTFSGAVFCQLLPAEDGAELRRALEAALRWTVSFGAEKSIGFGRLISVALMDDTTWARRYTPTVQPGLAADAEVFRLVLEFDEPFCIAKRRRDENLFESERFVPGNVIKGAFAQLLGLSAATTAATRDSVLAKHFSAIRVGHALPVSAGAEITPIAAPLSLGFVSDVPYDFALCPQPVLVGGCAPQFAPDWKHTQRSEVDRSCGWPKLETEMRVRSAQSREDRRAKDQALFAYESIVPFGNRWVSLIDLNQIQEPSQRIRIQQELKQLCQNGLPGIGKTKCRARVEFTAAPARSELSPIEGNWVVTLQSDALLSDPRNVTANDPAGSLALEYGRVWREILGPDWKLSHYFAQQELSGGRYLYQRFQRGKGYRPFLLTRAGSVFVFRSQKPEDESRVLASLIQRGLPLKQWVADYYYGDTWDRNPYVPENGFGSISVNQLFNRPPKGVIHVD